MVSSDDAKEIYTGSGTLGPFTIPFLFLEDDDIKVVKVNIATTAETELVLNVDYTLIGALDPDGGELTLTVEHDVLTSAFKLIIYRDPDALQLTDLTPFDKFPAESVERALDKMVMLIQRLREIIFGSTLIPRLSDGDISGIDLELPTPVASAFLRVNAGKTALEWALQAGMISVSAFGQALILNADEQETLDDITASLINEAAPAAADKLILWDASSGDWKTVLVSALSTLFSTITGAFFTTGIISPAQITANQNDYNPASLATAAVLRINSDARRNLTGLAGGAAGRILTIHNVGTFPILFKYEDAASAAANRFAFACTLGGSQSLELQYDSTSSRWRAKVKPEPIGKIEDFGGGTVPEGFLACDGAAVSRTTYAALFNEVGTTWGVGDGATTFNVPGLARRATVGAGGAGTGTLGNAVGNTGGAETHTLVTGEIPAHAHGSGNTGFFSITGAPTGAGYTTPGTDTGTITANTANAGGGGAHNIMQPSAVVTKVIRYL